MKSNTLKCVIVDDEEMAVRVIESHLSLVEGIEVVGVFHSGVEAFLMLDSLDVDVLFLDIQMPKITGLNMLKRMRNPPMTILTTAHRDYAIEGFDLDVVDYLLKPIGIDRFLQAISKIKNRINNTESKFEVGNDQKDHLFIRADRTYVKVFFKDILYIESIKNHIRITTTEKRYISLISLLDFSKKLPHSDFIRIHRSYLINIHFLASYDGNRVLIQDRELPIGKSYKEGVKSKLSNIIKL